MEKIKPRHKKIKFLVDKKSIQKFCINEEERRQIKPGRVSSILSILRKGEHFESDLVVNRINGTFRLIDGNHRIEAIKKMLEINPKFGIEVYLAKYENLSSSQEKSVRQEKIREKEREIYTKWSKGDKETTTDYIKQYFKVIPYGKQMLRELPVDIYRSEKKMSLKLFVGNQIVAKQQLLFSGMWGAGGEKAVAGLIEIVPEDIRMLKAFYSDMVEIFGEYYAYHTFYRTPCLCSFYRIWYDNRNIERNKFIEVFREVFAHRPNDWEQLSVSGGRNATTFFYRLALERLNDYRKRLHFLSDKEIKEEETY